MKVYKVTITGIVTTLDDDEHPENWDWSNEYMAYRIKDLGDTREIVVTEMKEVDAWQQEA